MSNRLGGKQGTAYLGTNANQPPNWVFSDRDPNQYDVNNVSLGDLWLNETDKSAWMLVSLEGDVGSRGSLATWVSLANDTHGALSTLTGNSGGVIDGDGNANINLVGDGVGITIDGDPVTHIIPLRHLKLLGRDNERDRWQRPGALQIFAPDPPGFAQPRRRLRLRF